MIKKANTIQCAPLAGGTVQQYLPDKLKEKNICNKRTKKAVRL
jgi:hypothetical protein